MTANLYRKKPVEVEAIQWNGDNFQEIKAFAGDCVFLEDNELVIKTLEDGKSGKAKHIATVKDFIIKGVQGEFYFCKPDIFFQTYDEVQEEEILQEQWKEEQERELLYEEMRIQNYDFDYGDVIY